MPGCVFGELAARSNLTVKTIRFYEQAGVLDSVERGRAMPEPAHVVAQSPARSDTNGRVGASGQRTSTPFQKATWSAISLAASLGCG